MAKKISKIQLEKDGVIEEFELAGGSDGIMAEGTVKGVRASVAPQTVTTADWKEIFLTYKDGAEDMIKDGRFTAPVTGIYMFNVAPDGVTSDKASTGHNCLVLKNTSDTSQVDKIVGASYEPQGARPATVSGVVKLEKGETLNVFYYSSKTISNTNGGEFYLISERTDGLVAEAKYEPKANWPVAWVNTTYASSTDTNVIALDGTITLPEDGKYLLSWDSFMPTNYSSHVSHTGLSKTETGDAIIDWVWYEQTPASAFHILSGVQVISGKKGDKFWLKNYQAAAQNSKTFNDEHKTHGVKLFKMSFAGSGGSGGGGTSDYDDLTNKPSINGVELVGDKTSNDLDIFSKVDYTYEDDTNTLNLLANEGAGKELTSEHKTGFTFNGKPVYEKVVTLNSLANTNIADLNIENIIHIDGTFFYPTSSQTIELNGYYGNSYVGAYYQSNELRFVYSSNYANASNIIVRLKYTKK